MDFENSIFDETKNIGYNFLYKNFQQIINNIFFERSRFSKENLKPTLLFFFKKKIIMSLILLLTIKMKLINILTII